MLNGSFSLKTLRWLEEFVDVLDRLDQKLFFSVGDGYEPTCQLRGAIDQGKCKATARSMRIAQLFVPEGKRRYR